MGADGRVDDMTLSGSIWDPQGMHRIAWYENGRLHLLLLVMSLLLLFSRLLAGGWRLVRRGGTRTPEPVTAAGRAMNRSGRPGSGRRNRLGGFTIPPPAACT